MNRRQRKSELGQAIPVQVIGLVLTMALVCLSAMGPATAQNRHFTGRTITGGTVRSLAKRDIPKSGIAPASRAATSRKRSSKAIMKPQGGPAACDVTIGPGASPAGSYLPLSGFGITPVAGVGDDSLIDFDVPPFTFAGETYSRIAFSSNGYAIVGGSSDPGDNTLINQNFPDPTVPNNVLAPFWTDLNPDNGGNLYIGVLTDGMDNWVVLDWEAVSEFSTVNQNSFQIWIGLNGDANPVEDISYVYGTMQGSGNGGFLTVGAENKIGSHGQSYYYNGTGTLPALGTQLRVATTSCVPTKPWTTTGSSGTIDEDSLPNAAVTNFVLGLKPATTGTVIARYNITPTRDLSSFCPANNTHIAIRFRDEDAAALGDQVLLTIHQTKIATGGDTTIFTFDSNVSSQAVGAAFQTFATDVPIDFDFGTSVYWVEVSVSRANANAFVNFASLQIAETQGTLCP